jgi:hypothetical protein
VDEWPQARRGDAKDIEALVRELHVYLASENWMGAAPPI